MDMFPQTTKQRKRLWICSLAHKNSKDIQPIVSSHIESVVLLSRNLQKKIDENNYFYQKGEPHVVNLFNTTSGVDGLCIRGKKLNVHHNNGETVIVTGDLLNETKEIDVQENEIRTIY